ncbi:efflux RND transporter periplasmic adaptor subunit [Hoeflea sp. WL0058]|uniref:Efflux RND transporter periplasmic adaptor subunit n=1 Tax=Flavimaribacter sediminis TaxID=2865987 RepID=A0AAE3D1N0_9HYPH|nr:efflux RND transporter periplasmic adaptor subunit [Flavimaribacter sediminis]MBW8637733.1 efflux RND transporter periplasmic adaptor subunit [Flavimaribacter sediminis]
MLKSLEEQAEKPPTVKAPSDPAAPTRRNGLRVIAQIILMIAVLAGSFVLMNRIIGSRPEPVARTPRPPVYAVETVTAVAADNQPVLHLYGEVQASRSVELRPLVGGEIVTVNPRLRAGFHVDQDDVLIEIDSFSYSGALAEARANLAKARAALTETEANIPAEREQLEEARIQLGLARSDLARAESLVKNETMTQKQVEERRLVVSQREQATSQRRNNLVILEAQRVQQLANVDSLQWRVDEAERNLENVRLTAPFRGVVSSANAEAGRNVSVSDVVATIYDDENLEVRFTLTDAQYGRIVADRDPLIGRRIEVRWSVGESDFRYSGTIDRIAAEIASARGGVEVVARLDPAGDGVRMRTGAFVEISVPDRTYDGSFRIPETALYDGVSVFVVNDGRLTERSVAVAAYDGDDVILGDGLEEGDVVLVTHLTQADEGVRVRLPGERAGADGAETGQ